MFQMLGNRTQVGVCVREVRRSELMSLRGVLKVATTTVLFSRG